MAQDWIGYLVAALALLLAWRWSTRWRSAREDGRRMARRHALVTRASLELQQLRGPDDVFMELPELLVQVLGCRWARVLAGEDDSLRPLASAGDDEAAPDAGDAGSVAARSVRERRMVYEESAVPDGRAGEGARTGRAPLLARPLYVVDRLVAVLEVAGHGPRGFDRADREALEAVGRLAEEALLRLAATGALRRRQRETEALARTAESLLLAQDQVAAAEVALRTVLDLLDVRSAAVLRISGDRLVPIARTGEEVDRTTGIPDEGVPFRDGPLRDVWREQRPLFAPTGGGHDASGGDDPADEPAGGPVHGAVVPVVNARGATRALLVTSRSHGRPLGDPSQASLLTTVATSLGATLQRLQLEHQLHELLDVVRGLAQMDDPEQLYGMAVAAAVRLIPGAEAATILVRRDDGLHYAGAANYDLRALSELGAFDEEEQLSWYGLGRSAFLRGVPRVLRGEEIARRSAQAGRSPDQAEILRMPGMVGLHQATLCVPIVVGQEILGMLNLDNLSLPEAFGDAEIELAEAFGQQIGVIIRQTQAREALARAAVTDPVTGVGNREGFNRRLATELARAGRRDEPVHLVMMDLDGFKRINDELGHPAGDLALHRTARALEEGLRAEDALFRWGGDEFALLISGVGDAEVRAAAERHAAAVERVEVEGRPLSISIGIASYPRDGRDAQTLLRRADDLMYERKHARDPLDTPRVEP